MVLDSIFNVTTACFWHLKLNFVSFLFFVAICQCCDPVNWGRESTALNSNSSFCYQSLKIFIAGQDGVSCLSIVEKYDPHANVWIKVAPMKSRRLGVSCSVLNGALYAVGGADGNTPLNSCERYDPRTDSWVNVTPMNTRRKHLGSAVLKNCLYAVGGRADNCELNTAEKYDPVMDAWTPVVSLNCRRSGVSLFASNHFAFCFLMTKISDCWNTNSNCRNGAVEGAQNGIWLRPVRCRVALWWLFSQFWGFVADWSNKREA